MKLANNKTGVIVMAAVSVVMIWDGICVFLLPENWSVSQFVLSLTGFNPFGFFAGIAAGHLFANMYPDTTELRMAWSALTNAFKGLSSSKVERMEAAIKDLENNGPLRYLKLLKKNNLV